MSLPTHLETLLDYDDWANREVVTSLEASAVAGALPPAAVRLLAHVVGASRLWLSRLRGEPMPCAVWPAWTLAPCAAEVATLRARWREWAAPLDAATNAASLDVTIAYVNSKGERHTSRVADVLLHVALHGTHHRAQLLTQLRAAGHTPPCLDFIHATRTGALRTG